MKNLIAIAILAVSTAFAGPAAATDVKDGLRARVVHFSDLDLTTDKGASTLYTRLRAAARDVCTPANIGTLAEYSRINVCLQSAMARAVTDVNRPALTSYYFTKVGKQAKEVVAMDAQHRSVAQWGHSGGM